MRNVYSVNKNVSKFSRFNAQIATDDYIGEHTGKSEILVPQGLFQCKPGWYLRHFFRDCHYLKQKIANQGKMNSYLKTEVAFRSQNIVDVKFFFRILHFTK